MSIICEKCQVCARHTNLHGYGVCDASKEQPCGRFVTEEELEQEVQQFYSKQGTFTGD